jgi:hypothetical protein
LFFQESRALPCVEMKTESFQTFGTQLALTEHA